MKYQPLFDLLVDLYFIRSIVHYWWFVRDY